MKYGVYLVYKEKRYIEVEAADEDEANRIGLHRSEESEPLGDDDIEVDYIEELDD